MPTPAGPRSKEANEKALRPWRHMVASAAFDQMSGYPPWAGPVALRAVFVFPRPKFHYRTGKHEGEVKENAPGWKPNAPDLDKLLRALGDSLTGVVVRDDAQLVDIHAVKIYGQNPGVTVRLMAV